MSLGAVIAETHRNENELIGLLLQVADRHRAEHDVFHVARDLAGWSRQHVACLAAVGRDHGVELDPEPEDEASLLGRLRRKGSELLGRLPEGGMLLLRDLREVHCAAAGVSLDWEVLAQAAQASRDERLLEVVQQCHPQTLRQLRWANAELKDAAAQAVLGS